MPVSLFWPALDVQRELVTLASADILLAEVASAIVKAGLPLRDLALESAEVLWDLLLTIHPAVRIMPNESLARGAD
jgi:hypothetical protein